MNATRYIGECSIIGSLKYRIARWMTFFLLAGRSGAAISGIMGFWRPWYPNFAQSTASMVPQIRLGHLVQFDSRFGTPADQCGHRQQRKPDDTVKGKQMPLVQRAVSELGDQPLQPKSTEDHA